MPVVTPQRTPGLAPRPLREYPSRPQSLVVAAGGPAKEEHEGMQCPHCNAEISVTPHVFALGEDKDGTWQVASSRCPTCSRLLVNICTKDGCTYPAWPASSVRPRLNDDVPPEFATDYLAACQIIAYSEEASAALSRRLLHRFLSAHTTAGSGGLAQQIEKTARSTELPPYLTEALHTLARVAKLGADSEKSKRPGALAPVEPGEAEWLLDVLQPLFELCFVQPARMRRQQNALEEKIGTLANSGTPAPPSDTGGMTTADLPGDVAEADAGAAKPAAEPADSTHPPVAAS